MRYVVSLFLSVVSLSLLWGIPVQAKDLDPTWEVVSKLLSLKEQELGHYLGYEIKPEAEEGDTHYLLKTVSPFNGGVDLFYSPAHHLTAASFYFVEGPIYLPEQAQKYKNIKLDYQLKDSLLLLGVPLEQRVTSVKATACDYRYNGWDLTVRTLPLRTDLHCFKFSKE
jgi:hypothetical protein